MFRRGKKKEPRKENKFGTMCSAVYRHFSFSFGVVYIFYKYKKFRVLLLPSFERNFLLLVVVFILSSKNHLWCASLSGKCSVAEYNRDYNKHINTYNNHTPLILHFL